MTLTSVQDLRRIVESVEQLRDRTVREAIVRSDCRQMRVTLDDGQILLISVLLDDSGKPRLDVDVLRDVSSSKDQLEVRFDGGE